MKYVKSEHRKIIDVQTLEEELREVRSVWSRSEKWNEESNASLH